MPEEPTSLSRRVRTHVVRTASAYDEWLRQWRFYDRLLPTAFLCGILCFLVYYLTIAAPVQFPSATLVKVTKGESVQEIASELQRRHLVHSSEMFTAILHVYGIKKQVIAGEYFFPGPESALTIAKRLAHGDYELVPVKVVIPEGTNTFQMAVILDNKIPDFDTDTYIADAQSKEGYLFPDSYFFLPGEDPLEVIATMEANFKQHISDDSTAQAIRSFHKPLNDIVTMASLIEKEANTPASRRVISGILWKRLSVGMPLQVDAVFPYIIGKNSLQLTRADLRTDSPYNTYTNKGLPPGPITNPGLDSILAAVEPVQSKYLYYLSDMQGNFHFSATYAQQLANQKKYLP